MHVEEQLKMLILSKYKSVRAFTQQIEVPYSTIDSMLKRGIGGASVSTVVRVCADLCICVDSLARGEIKEVVTKDISLTVSEVEHIKKYRTLDERGKMAVDNVLLHECELARSEKKDSEIDLLSENLA